MTKSTRTTSANYSTVFYGKPHSELFIDAHDWLVSKTSSGKTNEFYVVHILVFYDPELGDVVEFLHSELK